MSTGDTNDTDVCDVLVVGAGPVGLATASLLGRRGWRVTVLERWPEPYLQPRAVHFDDEVARLLAQTGVDPSAPGISEPADFYDWQNAAGETLLHFDWSGPGPSGRPTATMFHQPDLERALAAHGHVGVVIRPDHYLIGAASTPAELAAPVDDLHGQLRAVPAPALEQLTVPPIAAGAS